MKASAHRIEVKAMRLSHGLGLPLPQYQSEEAAGLDLMAAVPLTTPLRLLPGMRQLVPTGITVEIPPGFEGQVRPRSGLALNHGVTVLNAPGTIDSDYRGEIKVLLINHGRETFVVTRGQRIAQLVFQGVARAELIDVRAVAASRRGDAGFGSTGIAAAEPAKAAPPPAPRAPSLPTLMKAPPVAEKAAVAAVKPVAPIKATAPSVKTAAPVKPAPAAKSAPAAKATAPANDKAKAGGAAKPQATKPIAAKQPSAKPQSAKSLPAKAAAGGKAMSAKRPAVATPKAKVTARA